MPPSIPNQLACSDPCGSPGLQERLPRHGLGLSCQNHCLEGQRLCSGSCKSPCVPCSVWRPENSQQLKSCWLIRYQRGSDTAGNRNILEEPDICNALGQELPLTASQTSWEQCLLKVPSGELHHQEGKNQKKNGYFEVYKEFVLYSAIKMSEDGSVMVLDAWKLTVQPEE